MQRYRKIWNHFLEHEADDFVEERKLTIKEIKRIGIKKFIKANDWRSINDVKKWRTDVLEVVPCPHCKKDFGVMDETLGLCEKCQPKFDLKKFYKDVYDSCGSDVYKAGQAFTLFMADKRIRKQYLLPPRKPDRRKIYNTNYEGGIT